MAGGAGRGEAAALLTRKLFVAWEDVLALATKEDARDFAFRELRWLVLFFLLVLPFFFLQAHSVARNELFHDLSDLFHQPFETGFTAQFARSVNVTVNGTGPVETQLPLFWAPPRPSAEREHEFPRPSEQARLAADGGDGSGARDGDEDGAGGALRSFTFRDIDSPDKYWSWVQQIIGQKIIFRQMCGQDTLYQGTDAYWVFGDSVLASELNQTYETLCTDKHPTTNFLLQGVRIRQVMVAEEACDIIGLSSSDFGINCYGELTSENERQFNPWGVMHTFVPNSYTFAPTASPTEGSAAPSASPVTPSASPTTAPPTPATLAPTSSNATNATNATSAASESETTSAAAELPFGRRAMQVSAAQQSFVPYTVFVYFWQQAEMLGEPVASGFSRTYPAGGFALTLPLVSSSYYGIINKIYQYNVGLVQRDSEGLPEQNVQTNPLPVFFQDGTRAVVTSMTFYNPNVNLYAYVECVISISASGGWVPTCNFFTARAPNLDPQSSWERAEIAFAVLATLYMVLCLLRFLRNANLYRLKRISVVAVSLKKAMMGYTVYWIFSCYFVITDYNFSEFPAPQTYERTVTDPLWICEYDDTEHPLAPCGGQPPYFAGVGSYAKAYTTAQVVFASMTLLATLRLVSLLAHFGGFGLFGDTMYSARYNLLYFAIIYLVIFLGYALSAYVFYSDYDPTFASVPLALFNIMSMFVRLDVNYATLVTANALARVFAPIFVFSFYFIFLWVFAGVLLAEIYVSWHTVHGASFARRRRAEQRRKAQLRLATLYATSAEVDTTLGAGKRKGSQGVLAKMLRDGSYRGTGCNILCDRLCAVTRPHWVPKQRVRINLLEWKRLPANRRKHFLDFNTLREALAGPGADPERVPADQVYYYSEQSLAKKMLSKLEVDNLLSHMEIQGAKASGDASDDWQVRNTSGPSLSARKGVVSMVQDITKDHDLWLVQIDRYLASLRVRQARASKDFESLDKHIAHIIQYQQ